MRGFFHKGASFGVMVDLMGENLKNSLRWAWKQFILFILHLLHLSSLFCLELRTKRRGKKTDQFRPLSSGFSTPLAALLLYLIYQASAYLEEHVWVCWLFVDEHIFYRVSQCGVGGCSQTKTRPFMGVLVSVQYKHIDVTLVEFSQKLIFTYDMKGEAW